MKLQTTFREKAGALLLAAGLAGAGVCVYSANNVQMVQNGGDIAVDEYQSIAQTMEYARAGLAIVQGNAQFDKLQADKHQYTVTITPPNEAEIIARYNHNQKSMQDARFDMAKILLILAGMPAFYLIHSGYKSRNKRGMPQSHIPA